MCSRNNFFGPLWLQFMDAPLVRNSKICHKAKYSNFLELTTPLNTQGYNGRKKYELFARFIDQCPETLLILLVHFVLPKKIR